MVNNLDGLDVNHEFRDYAIANTAIQGPCRLAVSAEEAKRVQLGDVLYIGLHVTEREDQLEGEDGPRYKLELYRFFSSDVTRMKPTAFVEKLDTTKRAWAVGRIIDSNQSHRMTTIHVGVDQVQELSEAMLDMVVRDKRLAEIEGRAPAPVHADHRPEKGGWRNHRARGGAECVGGRPAQTKVEARPAPLGAVSVRASAAAHQSGAEARGDFFCTQSTSVP